VSDRSKTDAKVEIFASIRQHLAASVPFDTVHHEVARHHGVALPHQDRDNSERSVIDVFRENLEAVGGKCTIADSEPDAIAGVQKILDSLKPQRVAFSDASISLAAKNSIQTDATVFENASIEQLFSCDVGITSAQWAIAETGTLVLESRKERNRLASLVPGIHICLLEKKNIRRTMVEILETAGSDLNPAVTFITGPSRTSDIELTLAIGVHGPRELYVFVFDDAQS
jgi:L-lactate dehydrogenase complex protein LldG